MYTATREIFAEEEIQMEKESAEILLKSRCPADFLVQDRMQRTFCFAHEEAEAAGINKDSVLAFVGSGFFHESAIALATSFGAHITCIDKDPDAIALSRKVNTKLGLNDLISFDNEKAEKYDFGKFSHVFIAVMTEDKSAVLEQIALTNPGAKIIARTVENSKLQFYEPIPESALESFTILKKTMPKNSETIMHSLLLSPKKIIG